MATERLGDKWQQRGLGDKWQQRRLGDKWQHWMYDPFGKLCARRLLPNTLGESKQQTTTYSAKGLELDK
jgi:hypothetical protein